MAIKYGFYNSISGDRTYNATDFGSIFDGIIRDGIFESIYDKFEITIGSGLSVNVGKGKAWFNNTWIENDAVYPVTFAEAELLLNRIDAVVLEINATESVRANTIKVVQGTPSSTPVNPPLTRTAQINQYPLCFVNIPPKATSLVAGDIDNRIGTTDCPYTVIESGEIPSLSEINELIVKTNKAIADVALLDGDVVEDLAALNTGLTNAINSLSSQINGRVDTIDNMLITNGDGLKVLTNDGTYKSITPAIIDILTTSGTLSSSKYNNSYPKYRFVLYGGGGGGGKGSSTNPGGGGGGGGAGGKTITPDLTLSSAVYTVGAAGTGSTNGGNTTILGYTAGGGAPGGAAVGSTGGSGGSGGTGTTPGNSGSPGLTGEPSLGGAGGEEDASIINLPGLTERKTFGGNGGHGGIEFSSNPGPGGAGIILVYGVYIAL